MAIAREAALSPEVETVMKHARTFRFSILSGLLRLIAGALRAWPVVLIIVHFVSPVGLHMRWEYRYIGPYSDKTYTHCDYIGSRGVLYHVPHLPPDCPLFVILDSREFR